MGTVLLRDDSGMTLTELLVAMVILAVIMSTFFLLYFALSTSASNSGALSKDQGQVRNVMQVLEADLRSSDPLTLVPASFTSDPAGTSNSGTNGTSSTDIVAMYSSDDRYSPCGSAATSPSPPSPYLSQYFSANVIWAFDPAAHTLTRYSYCSSAWEAGMTLSDVASPAATMFTVAQTSLPSAQQQPLPTSTTVVNQSTPVCGTSITISIEVKSKAQQIPLRTRAVITLTNQQAVALIGCAP